MIRVSFGIYNTEEEVDYLLKVLPDAIKRAKAINEENLGLAEPLY
jgi:cysteine sulfinate desulfinase/cysteine desulfurase-like protein